MSKHLVGCHPGDSVARAQELMTTHQIRRLPVLDDERHVVGMITLSDLARMPHGSSSGPVALVATFAAVSQPRRRGALVTAA